VFAKVARRLSITGVKITTNHTAVALPFAVFGLALKDMNTAFIDVFDGRGRLKESIDR
jgi:hypothetical protein